MTYVKNDSAPRIALSERALNMQITQHTSSLLSHNFPMTYVDMSYVKF